jgi:hypothetical protein
VASTTLFMGRMPDRANLTFTFMGEGAMFTSVARPKRYSKHPSCSNFIPSKGRGHSPSSPKRWILSSLNLASGMMAQHSLATPRTLNKSPLLGVIESSITTSSRPSQERTSSPIGASGGRISMPSSSWMEGRPISSAESIIPSLLAPSKSRTPKIVPSAKTAPGGP